MAITINVNLDEILAALKDDLDFAGNADKYIKVNATADGFEFAAVSVGSTWGSITGTLSDQTDLQSALNAKLTANSPITGATKTKVTYDANGLITSGADATTADIADSLDKRYITDAQQTILGNTSGTNTGDETTSTIKTKLGAASSLQDGYLTSTDWTTFNSKQAALGFTPEDVANKSTSTSLGTSDTLYPSQNAVKSYVDTGLATKYDASNPSGYITGIAWGAITGTLSSQTDLQSALDLKANLAGASFTGDVSVTTSGSGDTLQLTNSGSGTTLNILNSGSGDFLTIDSTKLVIDNGGDVSIGTATASARFHVLTGSTSKVGAIIQAAAGQTANLFEINSSSGSGGDLFRVEKDGRVQAKEFWSVNSQNVSHYLRGYTEIRGQIGGGPSGQPLNVRSGLRVASAASNAAASNNDPSAFVQIVSTTQGFLPPVMTGAQVEAIATPAEGLIAYATNAGAGDVTAKGLYIYNGTNWVSL